MDYKKIYTPTEAAALYNISKIKYDPTSYSLKGNLITGYSAAQSKKEHICNYNYTAELTLIQLILNHEAERPKKGCNYSGLACKGINYYSFSEVSNMLIQQDNLHVCLEILGHFINLDDIKSTNVMQTVLTMCIALNSSKSCAKELFALYTNKLMTENYEDICTFKFFKDCLANPKGEIPCMAGHSVDPTYAPTVDPDFPTDIDRFAGADFDSDVDTLYAHCIAALEVLWAFNSMPEDYKACFVELCHSQNIAGSYDMDLFKLIIHPDISRGFTVMTDLKNAISEKDPAKRYLMYQDILAKNWSAFYDHCGKYRKVEICSSHLVNPIFIAYTSFVLQIALTNARVNQLRILYDYCVSHKYPIGSELEKTDLAVDAKFGGLFGSAAPAASEKALMNLDESSCSGTVSDDDDVEDTDHTSPAMIEALDKVKASFKSGKYSFDVKDVVETGDSAKAKYNAVAAKADLVNKLLIRRIKDIKTYNVGGKNSGKSSGRLDRKAMYRYKYDPNIFYDNSYKTVENDLAFGIILDESGSMHGKGIENGRITLVVLHETLKALGINHSIIGHTSDGKYHSEISRYQSFREDKTYTTCKNYAIVNTTAKWGNCDSGALYYMEKALDRVHNKDKICLIFSDGAPTECSGTDLKNQIKAMERKGIKVIGIGINFESIAKYYTDYANGRNLSDMLNIVAKILENYVLKKKDK